METAKEMVQKIDNICRKANEELEDTDPQNAEKLLAAISHFAFGFEHIVEEFLNKNSIEVDITNMTEFAEHVQELQVILAEREYSKGIDLLLEDLE